MNNKNLNKLISEALIIETEEAKEAGAIGYMARALVQATILIKILAQLKHGEDEMEIFL